MTTESATRATPNNPFVGKTYGGKYKIEHLIGRGGMGLVHRAREIDADRDVVVKMLAPHFAEDESAVARFEREGRRLAQLFHPNIVELYDLGWEEDQSYIVMEYIDGEPLRNYITRRGRLTVAQFAPIADQVLSAVAVAHEQQMMLRDIKPSNIMLCERDGKAHFVKMLDFGLAKLVDGDDVEVTKAHVIGTAGYLAPEQIKGEEVDVRVDVYALGILFFVMLTGRSPILGDNDGAVLYNHVHGEPLRLESTLPPDHEVPAKLIELVHQCMEKNPARRPEDARAIAKALRAALPAEMFELPDVTDEFRQAVDAYRDSKVKATPPPPQEPAEIETNSNEWTRPHLSELLDESAAESLAGEETHPRKPAPEQRIPPVRRPTMMGIAPAEAAPSSAPRRPPPARTPATANMVRTPGRRPTLSPLESHRRPPVRRPKPKALVKLEEAQIPDIDVEDPDDDEIEVVHEDDGIEEIHEVDEIEEIHDDLDEDEFEVGASHTLTGLPSPEADTTPRSPAPRANVPTIGVTPVSATTPAMPATRKTDPVGVPPPGTPEPIGPLRPLATKTEAALPVVSDQNGGQVGGEIRSDPFSGAVSFELDEPFDDLVVVEDDRPSKTLRPEPATPVVAAAAAPAATFGAGVTAQSRPVGLYVISGVLVVAMLGLIGLLMYDTVEREKTASEAAASQGTEVVPGTRAGATPESADGEPSADEPVRLEIVAPRDAMVFIDGAPQGTGTFVGERAPGTVGVRVEREGYQPYETTVDLPPGEPQTIEVELDRVPEPDEVEVEEDDPEPTPRPRSKPAPTSRAKPRTEPIPAAKPKQDPVPVAEPKPASIDPAPSEPEPSKPEPQTNQEPKPSPEPKPRVDEKKDDLFIDKEAPKKGGVFLPVGK